LYSQGFQPFSSLPTFIWEILEWSKQKELEESFVAQSAAGDRIGLGKAAVLSPIPRGKGMRHS
jgi:hypothetical protein